MLGKQTRPERQGGALLSILLSRALRGVRAFLHAARLGLYLRAGFRCSLALFFGTRIPGWGRSLAAAGGSIPGACLTYSCGRYRAPGSGVLMVQSLVAAAKAAHEAELEAWCLLRFESASLPDYYTRSQVIEQLPHCEALYVAWESAVDALDDALKAVDLS